MSEAVLVGIRSPGWLKDRQTLLVALAGVVCGAAMLASWVYGPLLLAAALLGLLGLRHPTAVWVASMAVLSLVANQVPTHIMSPLCWGLFVLFMAGAWWERVRQGARIELRERGLWMWIAAWLAWAAICTLHAVSPSAGLKETARYALSFLMLLTYLNWIVSADRVRLLVRVWQALAVMTAILCIVDRTVAPVMGPYPPEAAEMALLFAGLICIEAALLAHLSARQRITAALRIGILSVALVFTGARSGSLAAVAGVWGIAWWRLHRSGRRRLMVVTVAGILIVTGWLWVRFGNPVTGLVYNLSGRPLLWGAAMKAISQHPLLGIGPGSWADWFPQHFVGADFLLHDLQGNTFVLPPESLRGEAHNLFLTKAAEMGLLSLPLLAGMFVAWGVAARRAMASVPAGWMYGLALGCTCAMGGAAIRCFFENGPIIGRARGMELSVVWIMAALPIVIGRLPRQPESASAPGVAP